MITIELNRLVKNKILWDFDYDFYTDDEEIKKNFQSKFEDYYFFDEIGYETIGRFKHRLKTLLNMKMPYYKQLYITELKSKDIEFLVNKDYKETINRVNKDTRESRGTGGTIGTNESMTNGTNNNKQSSIDSGISKVNLADGFLTHASQDTNNASYNERNSSENNYDNTEINNRNEEYVLIGKGNIGVTSSAALLQEWREVLINIDEMIIQECRMLFMQVY